MARLFLDMDGVVADWRAGVEAVLGTRIKDGVMLPEKEWTSIKNCSRFFRALPLMPDADNLVRYCLSLLKEDQVDSVQFLTAIPGGNDMPWAFMDKIDWARQYFPGIPVFFGPYSKDKFHHCQPGDILIDDRKDNCSSWRIAGGLAHRYKNYSDCMEWFKEIGDLRGQQYLGENHI